ncbi:hypothetical protein HYX15_01380 [Candidatus Woesearchaeota archaeon]|nr:hypothetical protein [Candidatus Woesearchaeota archaeon]
MPDFKTHYLTIMVTIIFILGFFLIANSQNGLEEVTGRSISGIDNDAERIVSNYLSFNDIENSMINSYQKNNLWKVEVDIINSDFDVVFDVDENGKIKCFERDRERKCFDNFNEFNEEFLSIY